MLPPSASPWPSSWPSCPVCWLDELGLQLTFPSLKDGRKGEWTEREGRVGGMWGRVGVSQGKREYVREVGVSHGGESVVRRERGRVDDVGERVRPGRWEQ